MNQKRAEIFEGRINLSKEVTVCEICGIIQHTERVFCNHCQNAHHICTKCIQINKTRLKIMPVSKDTIFAKNLNEWK